MSTGAADFYYNHQRERLAACVLLQGELDRRTYGWASALRTPVGF
jgi:hypothetical protein